MIWVELSPSPPSSAGLLSQTQDTERSHPTHTHPAIENAHTNVTEDTAIDTSSVSETDPAYPVAAHSVSDEKPLHLDADPASPSETEQLLAYVDEMVTRFGCTSLDVEWALGRSSGDSGLAQLVLFCKVQGQPFPAHLPGVWTEEEDRIILQYADIRGRQPNVGERLEFLRMWSSLD